MVTPEKVRVITYRARAVGLKPHEAAADPPRVDAPPQTDLTESLAELELLVFGSTLEDEILVQKFLAADAGFNAHLVARLAGEPPILH
jgi:hypothetical protein